MDDYEDIFRGRRKDSAGRLDETGCASGAPPHDQAASRSA
jgi:hypothetical protein